MKFRHLLLALLALLLVLPAATAAAQDTATQDVQLTVLESGILTIDVEGGIGVGAAVPGTTAGPHWFWTQIVNTTTGGWDVTVTGNDLQLVDQWDCDDWGNCTPVFVDPPVTIANTNIHVAGGVPPWGDPNPVTAFEGVLGIDPLLIMSGTVDAWGMFSPDSPSPSVSVDVPVGSTFGDYTTTLTYTIQAPLP